MQQTEENSPPDSERADDPRSRALVPVGRRRRWRDPGARFIAALCYFAWLGWVTAPAPLLLLNSRRMRAARGVPYHLFAATGWSVLITAIRVVLYVTSTWLATCEGARAEAVCNALNLAHLVIALSFALLLSSWYALEALMGRDVSFPWLSRWAHRRANRHLGRE
ncbi:MAG: hypothetical protein ACOX9R_03445 [Armatimonadota bacterium]|jgi:hypothetical protein